MGLPEHPGVQQAGAAVVIETDDLKHVAKRQGLGDVAGTGLAEQRHLKCIGHKQHLQGVLCADDVIKHAVREVQDLERQWGQIK